MSVKNASSMKLFYTGGLRETHPAVGRMKFHFTAESSFSADVPENLARVLLRTGEYMPGGTDAARAAVARANRILGKTAAPESKAKPAKK
jgi:hypothetical protein